MSIKHCLFSSLFLVFLFSSCAPTFDLEKESSNIQKIVFNGFDIRKRIETFLPKKEQRESIQKFVEENEPFINELKKYTKPTSVEVNFVSSSITLQDRIFKIINATEVFSLSKKDITNPLDSFENYLGNNLIEYKEDSSKYTATRDLNLIAIFHKGSWEYFDYNVSLFYHAYGLKDTKKIGAIVL
ncbi:hypothetical protein [uncultured Kordia sp.]|uniref:hypothetical protein n=1 Tax=uncultured Kordia sp. TaxID=507699 RepID=UPI00261992D3|nr:hypothetical protein [uncultured Kordia sp.]